jgi:8-oxo-dGTP diphosphatase
VGFALAPDTFTLAELRDVYAAALGYEVSATNLKRILLRRGAIESTGRRRAHGPTGGRPAEVFRFRTHQLEVTDPFAVLRPPS